VDMGAYEFGIGDYDCDQAVNLVDLAGWEGCETGPVAVLTSARFGAGFAGPNGTTDSASLHPWQHSSAPAGASGCDAFDFDADGHVDLRDFAKFMLIAVP